MSESEEMYLVSIAMLMEQNSVRPVPLSALASELNVLPVSANQMIRKLEEAGLVCYTPYKGVDLTTQGQEQALKILRHRRLWEVFLMQHLGVAAEEAESMACKLEHAMAEPVIEKLAAYLGNPQLTPHGKPIPAALAAPDLMPDVTLADCPNMAACEVTHLPADEASHSFLAHEGIAPGAQLYIAATGSQGDMLVTTPSSHSVHLSHEITAKIHVRMLDSTVFKPKNGTKNASRGEE